MARGAGGAANDGLAHLGLRRTFSRNGDGVQQAESAGSYAGRAELDSAASDLARSGKGATGWRGRSGSVKSI